MVDIALADRARRTFGLQGGFFERGRQGASPWRRPVYEPSIGADVGLAEDTGSIAAWRGREAVVRRAGHPRRALLEAYIASAIQVGAQVQMLDAGAADLALGPVAVQALVRDVVEGLQPLARSANLKLMRDTDPRSDGVCCADPTRLWELLTHLVLRALWMERPPGHVRIVAALAARQARILILSQALDVDPTRPVGADPHDPTSSERLVRAMGGSLALRPHRAGYLALCLTLRALSPASAPRAA